MVDQSVHNHPEEQQSDDANESFHYHDSQAADAPLYPGASITVNVTMLLLLAFTVRHKLTNEAIADLLYLIDIICPQPNNSCKTLYNFKKFFSYLIIPVKYCYYWPNCINPIDDLAAAACPVCKKIFTSIKELCYFLHFSLQDQIKSLYARKYFLLTYSIVLQEKTPRV